MSSDANRAPEERSQPPIVRPQPLGDEVYNYLLELLVSRAIAPGERINIDQFAREVGVSQTPIRQALSRLEVHRLVVKHHLQGYRAAPQLHRREFENLTELRLLLEPAAAAKAASERTPEALALIARLAASMEAPAAKANAAAYTAFARLDTDFHALIAEQSGNDLIHQIVRHQHMHLHLFRLRFEAQVTQDAVAEHAAIIAALQAGDPDAAAAAMRRHIVKAHRRFDSAFE